MLRMYVIKIQPTSIIQLDYKANLVIKQENNNIAQ